jgi:hypothetical protein
MQLTASPQSIAALKGNHTIRCFVEMGYLSPRRSASKTFALVNDLVAEVAIALLPHLGQSQTEPPLSLSTQLNSITVSEPLPRNYLISFDIFLSTCPPYVRTRIDHSFNEPIHIISKSQDGNRDEYDLRRDPALDQPVALRHAEMEARLLGEEEAKAEDGEDDEEHSRYTKVVITASSDSG